MAEPDTHLVRRARRRRAVGCGALKDHGDGHRRGEAHVHAAGIAASRSAPQSCERIEALAREKGIERLVLETGDRQFRAGVPVYERAGFGTCGPLLDYPDSAVPLLRQEARLMTDLTRLTIAEAREKLRAREIYVGRTDRKLPRGDRTRQSPAQCLCRRDARQGARDGQGVGRAAGEGRGRCARRHSARHQGPVRHRRRPYAGLQPRARRLQAAL